MYSTFFEDARCGDPALGLDPEVFFGTDDESIASAKKICRRCPVRKACAAQALRDQEEFGTFGGLSAAERKPMIRRMRAELRKKAAA